MYKIVSTAKNRSVTTMFDARIGFYAKFGVPGRWGTTVENSFLQRKMDVFAKVFSRRPPVSGRPARRGRELDAPGGRILVDFGSIFGTKFSKILKSRGMVWNRSGMGLGSVWE